MRRFFRVTLDREGGAPAAVIARLDAPEDPASRPAGVPAEPPLEPIRAHLEAAGLPVPRRYGADARLELLEDLGPTSLLEHATHADAAELDACYAEACALVPRIQAVAPGPSPPDAYARHLDAGLFAYKAGQFAEWGLGWAFGRPASPGERDVLAAAFACVAERCAAAPQRLAHRDFKAANLMLPGTPPVGGRGRLVMIDLQGAFMAPPEYDLVCLLRDIQLDVPEDRAARLKASTRPRLPDAPSEEEFEQRFQLLTLSRVGKDLGRYVYAARERGQHALLDAVPRAWCLVCAAASAVAPLDPRLARAADLLDPEAPARCAP